MTPEARAFVLEHGAGARADHLAQVLGVPEAVVQRLRGSVVLGASHCRRLDFAELFTRWHGRPPRDDEWPAPRRAGGAGYEWLAPELKLLASLVGRVGTPEISRVLTERLRTVTGDRRAARNRLAVLGGMRKVGMQATDVLGGVTVATAAREIGVRGIIDHAIRVGQLRTVRVGRLLVIPHDVWAQWKAKRSLPPKGWIKLVRLRKALGIRSDKLSEWARAGHIPTATRVLTYGAGVRSTRWGTWYIDPKVARKILADRRAGRPMPWWGKPDPGNLAVTWPRYQARRHPFTECVSCQQIWGAAGPPMTFEAFADRYPPLAHGAKRHLTRVWHPGLTAFQLAREARVGHSTVMLAIANGALRARTVRKRHRLERWISRTDATRWKARHCPTGARPMSWLAIPTACRLYGFTRAELERHIASGEVQARMGTFGAQRGQRLVSRQQTVQLRERLGFSEREAARRVGVSVARLRTLLRGLQWRPAPRIPLVVVQNAQKRHESYEGVTLAEAAAILGKSVTWVRAEIRAGTIRPLRTKWDRHRLYVSFPMFKRLCDAALKPRPREAWTSEWVHLSEAAGIAGVSTGTIQKWRDERAVRVRRSLTGDRYHRRSVMARARTYWRTVRFKRATPPAWLRKESEAA